MGVFSHYFCSCDNDGVCVLCAPIPFGALFYFTEVIMQKNETKNFNFEKQSRGTIFTIIEFLSIISGLLILIGLFLPVCRDELFNKTIGIFDFTETSTIGIVLSMIIIMISMGSLLLIKFLKSKAINEQIDKRLASIIILVIAGIALLTTLIFVFTNLPILIISIYLDVNTEILSAGAGCILFYIASIISSIEAVILALLYYAILNNKIKIENFTKIINFTQKNQ